DRLEDDGARGAGGLLEGHRAGDLERHLGGVDVVIGAEGEGDPDVDDRVPGEHAGVGRLADARVDGRDVLLRDHTTGDLVDELVAATRARRLEGDDHVAVLAVTTGLADVALLDLLDLVAHRLAVGDLRLADVGVDV